MSCVRFEAEGLLAFERGEALDPHFDACPECAAAKGEYERLRAGLAAADEGIEAPAGFESRVWARIALQAPAERAPLRALARAWRPVGAGLAAAVATGIAVFLWAPGPKAPVAPSLAVEIREGTVKIRGTGDILHLIATTSRSPYAELRVYRAGNVVLHCSSEPPCRREGDRIEVEAPIKAPGRHELVLLLSDAPLPEPKDGFDADMDAAARAGAQILTAAPVEAY